MEILEEIREVTKEVSDACIDFAQRLIRTKSISCYERAVSQLYMDEMNKLGFDRIFRDGMGNVVGLIDFDNDGPVLMYNSHMDHVDEGCIDNWEGYDPYGGLIDNCLVDDASGEKKEESLCIHGRAASDVKGGAATAIYAGAVLCILRQRGYHIKGTFMFTGVVQEEPAEMAGISYLLDETFPKHNLDYDAMVSSEASSLKLVLGGRGRVEMEVTVYGRTSHGSTPWRGVNAIEKAVPLLARIKEYGKTLPEDKELGKSTITPTIISCSPGQLSIIPDMCKISLDRRLLTEETAQAAVTEIENIIDEIAKEDSQFKAEVKIRSVSQTSYTGITNDLPKKMVGWKTPKEHPMVKVCAKALEEIGQTVSYGYWDFGTDASRTAGIDRKPCIGYSPMQEQYAHTPYDKVRCDFMSKAIEGNAAIFVALCQQGKECFNKI